MALSSASAVLDTVKNKPPAAATSASSTTGTTPGDQQGTQATFLKLLTTQLQNQDPLSPMDNAQLTSQIAQINTVTGISALNTSVQGLASQFLQMQTLQGASLVGKNVIVPGDKLDIESGNAQGAFSLDSPADAVKVEVMNPAGQVVDTLQLGTQGTGMHSFNWASGKYDNSANLSFRVTAASGTTALTATPLMTDQIDSVSTSGTSLMLQLQNSGTVPYSTVRALN
jgi:flagellar basal-body rod modification protein FlgD